MKKFNYNLNIVRRLPDPVGLQRLPDKVKRVEDWYNESDVKQNTRFTGFVDRGLSVILLFQIIVDRGITVYDIAFEVDNRAIVSGKSLMTREIYGVFSNMLSFKFMYTYWFNQHQMIIPELQDKCNYLALSKRPTRTNNSGLLGIDKSLYAVAKWVAETYEDLPLTEILTKPENKKNKTKISMLTHLVAHQDEIGEIRKNDKARTHSKFAQNYPADQIISERKGSIQKEKYKSTVSDRTSRKIVKDIRDNALTKSGKKDLIEKAAKVKVGKVNSSHHKRSTKSKVKGKIPKKSKRR